MRAIALVPFLLFLSLGCVAAEPVSAPTFVEFVITLDQAQPIDRSEIERLIGRALQCEEWRNKRGMNCRSRDLEIGGVNVADVDFRLNDSKKELMFILGDITGNCVPVDAFDRQFGNWYLDSPCTDGVLCFRHYYKRPWGLLSVGLGNRRNCAELVWIDYKPQ